jgi:peptide/nickel transport system substrate-binding protein
MKQGELGSPIVLGGLALLVALALLNTCQRDQTERAVIDLGDRLDSIERTLQQGDVSVASSRPSGGIWGVSEPDYVTRSLAHPANLLERDPTPWQPDEAQEGSTLYLHMGNNPKGFNIIADRGAYTREIGHFTTQLLIHRHRSDTSRWGPGLAYSMTTPDDGLTYVFELREDFTWQKPVVDWASGRFEWLRGDHRVTAHDVVFAIDMMMNEQVTSAAPFRSYLESMEHYRAVDDFTFEIKFGRKEYSQRAVILASLFPMPEHLYAFDETGRRFDPETIGQSFQEHWYEYAPGCGPYRMVEYESGVKVVLERNPDYPLGGNAFDKIVYLILNDQNQVPRKLRTEELTLGYLQPGQYRTEVLEGDPTSPFKDGSIVQGEWWEYSWFYIGWNMRRPPFDDVRVRTAMSHAFDGDRILADVFLGLGKRNSGPMPATVDSYDDSIPPVPFDLAAAAALLDEAGWADSDGDGLRDKEVDGELMTLEFDLTMYGSSDEYRILATIFKEDLAQVGVKMNLKPMEWSLLLKDVYDRSFDAFTLSWTGTPDQDFRQVWHSSQVDLPRSSNHVGFADAAADALIEELSVTFDADERVRIGHEFHALIAAQQPYTFFYTRKRPAFWQRSLGNVRFGLVAPYRDVRFWHMATEAPAR